MADFHMTKWLVLRHKTCLARDRVSWAFALTNGSSNWQVDWHVRRSGGAASSSYSLTVRRLRGYRPESVGPRLLAAASLDFELFLGDEVCL